MGTFVNTSGLEGGYPLKGDKISTMNAGFTIMILAKMNTIELLM